MSILPTPTAIHTMVERIRAAGLVATLSANQPVDLLLEMGDALLASPILTVAIPITHPEASALLIAYRERFGDHLLLGTTGIASVEAGREALANGAEFLITTRYDTELHQMAARCGALYIPPATATAALAALDLMDVLMATIQPSILFNEAPWAVPQRPALLVSSYDSALSVATCAQRGAAAILVEARHLSPRDWSMPTMIRTARHLRRTWFENVPL